MTGEMTDLEKLAIRIECAERVLGYDDTKRNDVRMSLAIMVDDAKTLKARLVALETENRRLREALEKIVAPSSSSDPRWWREIARRALQGDQNVTGT